MPNLIFELCGAKEIPTRAKPGDAGFDLKCKTQVLLVPGETTRILLGVKVAIPEGWCGLVIERSGHAAKYGLRSIGPLIDSGYRGEISAILQNGGMSVVRFDAGDRVAQLLVTPHWSLEAIQGEVGNSERGINGIGSTGN